MSNLAFFLRSCCVAVGLAVGALMIGHAFGFTNDYTGSDCAANQSCDDDCLEGVYTDPIRCPMPGSQIACIVWKEVQPAQPSISAFLGPWGLTIAKPRLLRDFGA
jgi:hypothetical protein